MLQELNHKLSAAKKLRKSLKDLKTEPTNAASESSPTLNGSLALEEQLGEDTLPKKTSSSKSKNTSKKKPSQKTLLELIENNSHILPVEQNLDHSALDPNNSGNSKGRKKKLQDSIVQIKSLPKNLLSPQEFPNSPTRHSKKDKKFDPIIPENNPFIDSVNAENLGKKFEIYDNIFSFESINNNDAPLSQTSEIHANTSADQTLDGQFTSSTLLSLQNTTPKKSKSASRMATPNTKSSYKSNIRRTPITDREIKIISSYNPIYANDASLRVAKVQNFGNHDTQKFHTKGYKEIVNFLESIITKRFGSLIPAGQANNPEYHYEPQGAAEILDSGLADTDPYEIKIVKKKIIMEFLRLLETGDSLRNYIPIELEPYLNTPVNHNSSLKVLRVWTDWELTILVIVFNAFLEKTGLRKRTLIEFLYYVFPQKGIKFAALPKFSDLFNEFLPHRQLNSMRKKIEIFFYPLSNIGEFTEEEDKSIIQALENGMKKSHIALSMGRTISHINARISILQTENTDRNSAPWTHEEDMKLLDLVNKYMNNSIYYNKQSIPFKQITKEMNGRKLWAVRHRWVTRFADVGDPTSANFEEIKDYIDVKSDTYTSKQLQLIQSIKKKCYKNYKDIDWDTIPKKFQKIDSGNFIYRMKKLIGSVKDVDSILLTDTLNFVQKQILDNERKKLNLSNKDKVNDAQTEEHTNIAENADIVPDSPSKNDENITTEHLDDSLESVKNTSKHSKIKKQRKSSKTKSSEKNTLKNL
ncbi:hypothetical protein BB561_001414 [Smittium simulii]|uniref:Myb-like domain-containing protein n=1 Tax=Smittium simulii TaxID=133385 RepID=A0A2T9YUP9_9FUNG|nr:hypothetical protein BB561_001414 [Smittium simulii]